MAQTPVLVCSNGESIDYTPGSDVAAGAVVVQGTLLGIAPVPIAANTKGSLRVRCIADVPKDSSNLSAVGTAIYWDADGTPYGLSTVGAFTSTPTGNTFAGWCLETAGATTATVRALIVSGFAVSVTTVDALSDVGTVNYAAGSLLVGDGSKFENVAISGNLALSSAGVLTKTPATMAANGNASQTDATAITALMNLVTAADGAAGVRLPAATAGKELTIKNGANANLLVYPATGDRINAVTTNGAYTMAAYTCATFTAYDTEFWYTTPLVAS